MWVQKGQLNGSHLTNRVKARGGMSVGPWRPRAERSGWVDGGGYSRARSVWMLWELTYGGSGKVVIGVGSDLIWPE